jgi:hypothetical protein
MEAAMNERDVTDAIVLAERELRVVLPRDAVGAIEMLAKYVQRTRKEMERARKRVDAADNAIGAAFAALETANDELAKATDGEAEE